MSRLARRPWLRAERGDSRMDALERRMDALEQMMLEVLVRAGEMPQQRDRHGLHVIANTERVRHFGPDTPPAS